MRNITQACFRIGAQLVPIEGNTRLNAHSGTESRTLKSTAVCGTAADAAAPGPAPCYRSLGSDSSASRAFAARRSGVSNPSVNQL